MLDVIKSSFIVALIIGFWYFLLWANEKELGESSINNYNRKDEEKAIKMFEINKKEFERIIELINLSNGFKITQYKKNYKEILDQIYLITFTKSVFSFKEYFTLKSEIEYFINNTDKATSLPVFTYNGVERLYVSMNSKIVKFIEVYYNRIINVNIEEYFNYLKYNYKNYDSIF